MNIIVGLGNPGVRYRDTRHNIGFLIVEQLGNDLAHGPVTPTYMKGLWSDVLKIDDTVLIKPRTYMNESGKAVAAALSYYHVGLDGLWVVHDDLDLPLGKIRIREKGSSGGHNGVTSVIRSLRSEEFVRFRIGIGHVHGNERTGTEKHEKRRTVISYVLNRFTQAEAGTIRHTITVGSKSIQLALNEGVSKAMNIYNRS